MVNKNNKTCILCGKKYTFCNRCEEFDHLPRWMGIYCSENCKNVFMTVTDYKSNEIDKNTAVKMLSSCDLSEKEKYHKSINATIDELLQSDNSTDVLNEEEVMNAPELDNDAVVVKKTTRSKRTKK